MVPSKRLLTLYKYIVFVVMTSERKLCIYPNLFTMVFLTFNIPLMCGKRTILLDL